MRIFCTFREPNCPAFTGSSSFLSAILHQVPARDILNQKEYTPLKIFPFLFLSWGLVVYIFRSDKTRHGSHPICIA